MRVLGVPVGQVDTVTPSGTDVVVTMSYDADVKIPADAKAAIIAPSIVGDRFVQLTPVYTGGEVLADDATLDTDRTAVPLELDQIYTSLDDLTVALGPDGCQQERRAERPARDDRGELRRPGRPVPPDDRGLRPAQPDPRRQQGGAVRLRRAAPGLHQHAGRRTTRRCAASTTRSPRSPRCWPASGRSSRRRWTTSPPRSAQVSTFVQDNRDVLGTQHHRAQAGRRGAGQAARRARRDPRRRAARAEQPGADLQPADRHARHQRQHRQHRPPDPVRPRRAAVRPGRAGRQDRRAVRPGPGCARPARHRRASARRGATSTTRRSAASWRWTDEAHPADCSPPSWPRSPAACC